MITKVPSYMTSRGQVCSTLEDAQAAEIHALLTPENGDGPAAVYLKMLLMNKEKVVDILTMSPTSLPKARKVNGGRKPRKAAKIEADAAANEARADALA